MSRSSRSPKTTEEKKRYVENVRSHFATDSGTLAEAEKLPISATLKGEEKPKHSNDPSYKVEENVRLGKRPVPVGLRFSLFFQNNWFVTVVGGIVVVVLCGIATELFTTAVFRATSGDRISRLETNSAEIKAEVKEAKNKLESNIEQIQGKIMEQSVDIKLNKENISRLDVQSAKNKK